MKTNPKIIAVVLIMAFALAVFVWMYSQKFQKDAPETEASNEAANPKTQDPTQESTATKSIGQETMLEPLQEPSNTSLEIATIELPRYDIARRTLDYLMNYQGAIVLGSYHDAMLSNYTGGKVQLLQEQHNGVTYQVEAAYLPKFATNRVEEEQPQKVAAISTSTKSGATKVDRLVVVDARPTRPNAVILSFSKGTSILKWKAIDLNTGAIYNSIPNVEGAAHKEGDYSKQVYYLD